MGEEGVQFGNRRDVVRIEEFKIELRDSVSFNAELDNFFITRSDSVHQAVLS